MSDNLWGALDDHAKDKRDVVAELAIGFATILNPLGWQMLHGGKGHNSWRLYLPSEKGANKIWCFTGYDSGPTVRVRNAYWWKESTQRFTIRDRTEARRFIMRVARATR